MPTVDPRLRARLQQIREQRAQLQQQRNQAKQQRDEAKEALAAATNGGTPDLTSPEFARAQAATQRVASIDMQLDDLKSAELDVLNVLGATLSGGPLSGSETILDNPQVIEQLQRLSSTTAPIGRMQLGEIITRDEMAGMIGRALGPDPYGFNDGGGMLAAITDNAPSMRQGPSFGIVPQMMPPLRFLDLMPSRVVDGNQFPYVVETGAATASAAETAEGAMKPEAGLQYDDRTAFVRTIASFTKLNKQQLADSADLAGRVRARLAHGVLARLEGQVLNGNGAGQNLQGILNTTGLGVITFTAGAIGSDQVLRGIGAAIVSGAQPNVCALSVNDWVSLNITKAAGSGEYLLSGALAQAVQQLWGAAIVPVPSLADGNALVADTRLLGRVLVREGVNVNLSDNDQDDFTRNRVTFLGEGRFGLIVEQPTAAVKVALA